MSFIVGSNPTPSAHRPEHSLTCGKTQFWCFVLWPWYGLAPPGAGALRAEAERMAVAGGLVADRGQSPKTIPSARKVSPA
ncbi:MAG: hypothetical protein LBV34_20115 [Nocardiopsaceae bacterium]|nr:hypothetical protein [Nocardiopsaceae bacterium]